MIFQAVRQRDLPAIRQWPGRGAGVNVRDSNGNTPLHLAAYRGYVPEANALIEQGADVNATNRAGATPLLYGTGSETLTRTLLEHGANPNIASLQERTPLMAAVQRNQATV